MNISELEVKNLHKVANWLYHMNEIDHHYVAWLASDPNEIFEQIWTLTQFKEPLAFVAWEGEEIIGFLGILPFFEQKLCRLLGPFATKEHQAVIESMWDKASVTMQLHFDVVKVACFEANHHLLAFTKRHDFELYNVEKTLAVHRTNFEPSHMESNSIKDMQQDDFEAIDKLHPKASYYTTEEMIQLSRQSENQLWGYQLDGEIAGYLYFETILEGHEGEICFVNVDKHEQGSGIGTDLIEHALQYAFHALHLDVVTLSVRTQNEQAENLYRRFGFREINTIHAYQKTIEKQKPPVINIFH
ncbi:GNAT family N-acetyltransferase [Halobacillus sp. B29]|uniref:GNAT family N-acetyltransferase n=1 Tax=Halobacillus sp. B29 TaxID=3457432 RepID=UPI003FCD9056